ncbi:MAG TPA: formylglycine-generating enzyme family protein [Opitutus sp.]|nr:formylglycine-generating enzyme family protein [Opitutus sp.]
MIATRRSFVGLLAAACAAIAACAFAGPPEIGQAWAVPLAGNATIDLAWVPAGSFTMGSPADEPGRNADESPRTIVTISRGFWLGRNLVTIGQWKAVTGDGVREQLARHIADDTLYDLGGKKQTLRAYMNWPLDADPAAYLANEEDDLPMYFVSWSDAMAFARRLTERERAAGRLPEGCVYTLPTEAQWEYACRAGTTTATYDGPATPAVLDRIAWYAHNSADGYTGRRLGPTHSGPRAVGAKAPNAWGLHDMAGNIWEWCRDWYAPYPGGRVADPTGPSNGTSRVNRGGSFGSGQNSERSACRAANPPDEASAYRGFRIALSSR